MISLNRADYQYTLRTADWVGLSTDEFNNLQNFIELNNGDKYTCIDTGAVYLFDGENDAWVLQPESGGGGSGDAGVTSFNGRTGAVEPQAGDYPPALIGAVDKTGDTMTGDLDMSGNDVTGVHSVIAEGSTNSGLLFESNGTIVGVVTGGTRSATFTANSIDAYEHRISRVGEPLNDTDAARKQDVDAVQTAVDTVSETVNDILNGTEAIPYLPDNGGTLTGALNMGNNKITMGATPTATTDVTNKGYVDGVVKVVSDELDAVIAGTMPITLPIASDTYVGGVKVGTGLSVEEDGTLNVVQTQSATPIASATELGCVKVGTGLAIEEDGSLEATAGLYRDAASGIVFVGPNTSKTMRLSESFQVLYGTEYGISEDALDPEWGGPFYMNAGQSKIFGNLQVSFNQNGAEFTITNSHASVCYFFMYGGYSLPTT